MMLAWWLIVLVVGGAAAGLAGRWRAAWSRWIALGAVSLDLVLGAAVWARTAGGVPLAGGGPWIAEIDRPWIPALGIHFHLALDGLSLLLVLLTFFLGITAILASWREIEKGVGFFHLNLLWILAGIVGVFLAVDLFLFYFAWELMLVPMYFLIAIWGHERRQAAAVKFFVFTQLSGLLMLVAILALYFVHHRDTGVFTFQYAQLLGTAMSPATATWIMLGFLSAFAVKLPVVPLHTWLPDAHTEAPTAGSVILAGLLLKTGAYGLIRFVVPLFPAAAAAFAPVAMALAVVGILYGALLAFGQTDLKRLVAYTSVSHLGFVLLGVFAWNDRALEGAVVTMICHGMSTGALFVLAGALQERLRTREMARMGGLWAATPRLGGAALFFTLASIGLPGLGDFVGEFLILLGVYQVGAGFAVAAAIGILASTFYGLRLVQAVFHGSAVGERTVPDLALREWAIVAPMAALLLWLGFYPKPVLVTFEPAMNQLQRDAQSQAPAQEVARERS